jgi:hypothetical protein
MEKAKIYSYEMDLNKIPDPRFLQDRPAFLIPALQNLRVFLLGKNTTHVLVQGYKTSINALQHRDASEELRSGQETERCIGCKSWRVWVTRCLAERFEVVEPSISGRGSENSARDLARRDGGVQYGI